MMPAARVGIIGGRGAVGRALARQLRRWKCYRLRIGGRDASLARAFVDELGGGTEWFPVDVHDPGALRSFCTSCDVIVNCAGPARAIGGKIGRAAVARRAHYVDASATRPFELPPTRCSAVFAAGMYPGLTGLLPRFLAAQGFERVTHLTAYVGGCDQLSPVAAGDYIDSLDDGFGLPNRVWRDGQSVSVAPTDDGESLVPFFPRPVVARPYLTLEAKQVAARLGLAELRWYTVFDGRHVLEALTRNRGACDAQALAAASRLDLFGREPYQILLFEMKGTAGDTPLCRTLLVKASGAAGLTGLAMAATVRAAVDGVVPEGVSEFALAVDPAFVVDCLTRSELVPVLEVFDAPLALSEAGEL